MEKVILQAEHRSEKGKKVRDLGLVPGVLYGAGEEAVSVQFDTIALRKILTRYGTNAKVWINLDNKEEFGIVKEVQKHPVEDIVLHIDVQKISQDQEIKLQIPLTFTGTEELDKKQLILLIVKSEVEVIGKATLMPNNLVINVADKEDGDNITSQEIELDEEIKIMDAEDEVYAVIREQQEQIIDEDEDEEGDMEETADTEEETADTE